MKLDNLNTFCDIDISMCKTNEEKINKILTEDESVFYYLFDLLNNEEQEKYCNYLQSYRLKIYLSTKDDNFIFNFISKKYSNMDRFIISDLINFIKNEDLKYQIITFLLKKIPTFYIGDSIINIENDRIKLEIIKYMLEIKIIESEIINTIKSLKDDKNKEIILNYLSIYSQVSIIKSFKDKNLIKEYSLKQEYSNYRSELIAATEDKDFIKEQFLKINVIKFRCNIISLVKEEDFKIELINLIDDNNIKYFLLSNFNKYQNDYLQDINKEEITNSKIDENITFGVELECCNKDYKKFNKIKTILKNFEIVSDSSVKDGFEIVSPILHFTVEDLQKLKSVCKILEKCNFYTDSSCGGHIHIGANYLKNIEDIYMLLYLYTNCEHIIYKICNKEHSKPRKNINHYAKETKKNYLNAIKANILNGDIKIDRLKKITETRYTGLNFQNLDDSFKQTIEFRMPNGEIEFQELFYNIKLFTKLVQKSHELANTENNEFNKRKSNLLSLQMPEKYRLEIFLSILFDSEEDQKIYRKRYYSNRDLVETIKKDFFYKNEELIEIDKSNKQLMKKKNQI